jgi:hypothetical protein
MRHELENRIDLRVYADSETDIDGTYVCLAALPDGSKMLCVDGDVAGFAGRRYDPSGVLLCPPTAANAATLRSRVAWLRPVPLGLRTSAGFGDRLGVATPGHIRAIRRVTGGESAVAPIFAQQSVRENTRTGRTPQQVLDDATWGVFQSGWRQPWGADADHLKTPEDAVAFIDAGYTFFTIDPGDHVDDHVDLDQPELEVKVLSLPWDALETTLGELEQRYLPLPFEVDGEEVSFGRLELWRAAAKYGRAVAHTAAMYRHIQSSMSGRPFELEVSVDETSSPTTVAEHIYIACELRRLGVSWVSLAPRFVGSFEKGVDYIGDVATFTDEFARHAAVARHFGPYKLSLHSGSDKFGIYPIVGRLSQTGRARSLGPLVHLKTAGTSFLEALRTIAQLDVALFREILDFARSRYETDRATYHVSAEVEKVPAAKDLDDTTLPDLLEQFDARQVLHVTFGSVLDRFGNRLHSVLSSLEEPYFDNLERHFERHLTPFVPQEE